MAADQKSEKPVVSRAGDAAAAGTAGKAGVDGAQVLQEGQQAALSYGKNQKLGDLPTSADLLAQIAIDEKAHGHGQQFDRLPYKKEREIAAHLTPEDLQSIGKIVDAIKSKNYGSSSTDGSLAEALKQYQDNPQHLIDMKDMITLELERQKLGYYNVDVQSYSEKDKPKAAFFVSNSRTKTDIGFTTDGVKVPPSLGKLIYD
ncbi:MAG TPA: hypothetical protein V6C97_15965 [Oculatellaceae cyanobacterium]